MNGLQKVIQGSSMMITGAVLCAGGLAAEANRSGADFALWVGPPLVFFGALVMLVPPIREKAQSPNGLMKDDG